MKIKDAIRQFVEFIESGYDEEEAPSESAIDMALESIEKQEPKEPYGDKSDERTLWKCPDCGYIFVTQYADGSLCAGRKSKHCPECGQAIDWKAGDRA